MLVDNDLNGLLCHDHCRYGCGTDSLKTDVLKSGNRDDQTPTYFGEVQRVDC